MKFKPVFSYVLILSAFSLLIWFALSIFGSRFGLSSGSSEAVTSLSQSFANVDWDFFFHDPKRPFILLLLQLIIIIAISFVFGKVATRIALLPVIGEIIAGIVLGPSVLGSYAPSVSEFLFPTYSLSYLYIISQVGLMFFMFIIGMELDLSQLRTNTVKSLIISHGTIGFSCLLAVILSCAIYTDYAGDGVALLPFALFMSVALSITAFPVLARILQESNLVRTKIGTLLMTVAAIDDATAWCLLAVAVALAGSSSLLGAFFTISSAIFFVLLMFKVIRPWMKRLVEKHFKLGENNTRIFMVIFLMLLISSFITRFIGVHILFGAFVAGAIIPYDEEFRKLLTEKLKDVSLILFLPVFFTLAGLRTHMEVLNNEVWGLALVIIVLAMLGKIAGGIIFSRLTGQNWKDSLFIGTMLNTRGLMELIVLNIGFDLGIISQEIYTVMIIMALVTTFMTSPLLKLHKRIFGAITV